jgi:hypothetical protein
MTHSKRPSRRTLLRFTKLLLVVAPVALLGIACDEEREPRRIITTDDDPDAGEAQGGTSGNHPKGDAGKGAQIDIEGGIQESDAEAGGRDGGGCVEIRQEAKVVERPIDIIFLIDNSGSMGDDIAEVKARINTQFAQILEDSKVDYRVIMFTRYGRSTLPSSLQVCVKSPLGPDDCGIPTPGSGGASGFGGAAGMGGAAGAGGFGLGGNGGAKSTSIHNPPRFFHYDVQVESTDSLCLLFDAWTKNDLQGGPPWSSYLRPGTHKVFVEITDDAVSCVGRNSSVSFSEGSNPSAAAMKFDAELRGLSEEHFGTKQQRLYTWYSIVGMPINNPINEPWPTDKPLQRSACLGAPAPGLTYQALSMGTGGLRWSICNNKDFSPMFKAIAGGVVRKALPCNWTLPAPPSGKAYDATKLGVQLSSNGEVSSLKGVGQSSECGSGWVLDNPRNPREISLCPDTCKSVKESQDAKIEIVVPCESVIEMPE